MQIPRCQKNELPNPLDQRMDLLLQSLDYIQIDFHNLTLGQVLLDQGTAGVTAMPSAPLPDTPLPYPLTSSSRFDTEAPDIGEEIRCCLAVGPRNIELISNLPGIGSTASNHLNKHRIPHHFVGQLTLKRLG